MQMVLNIESLLLEKMEGKNDQEMAAIFKRFGDEQSTLFDQYERHSFEVQLNQAILGRSLSEPAVDRLQIPAAKPVKQGRRVGGSGFQRVMKKLLRSILGRKGCARKDGVPADPIRKEPDLLKMFSRSVRV